MKLRQTVGKDLKGLTHRIETLERLVVALVTKKKIPKSKAKKATKP
jgi:hypothetical protein